MAARADQNKYMAGCETMLNFIPLVLGGAYVRPGLQYVAKTKTVTGHQEKIMRPFVASRTAAYAMELGHQYVRFFRSGAPVFPAGLGAGASTVSKRFSFMRFDMPWEEPLPKPDGLLAIDDRGHLMGAYGLRPLGELVTPYTDTDLAELFLVQSVDVVYLFHRNYPPQKITRITETEFTITQVNFNPPATQEEEPTGADLGGGTLTPSAITGAGVTFTAQNSIFLAADTGRLIVAGGSRALITGVAGAVATATVIDNFVDISPIAATAWRLVTSPQTTLDITNDKKEVGEVVTLTAAAAAFRSQDVDKWITMFGGLLRIDSVDSSTSLTATIKIRLKDITQSDPAATRAWTIEVSAWSAALGYPSCGTFFDGRLWACDNLSINGSRTEDFENFGRGADASDAIRRTISDDDIDSIVWIKGDKVLKVGTGSGVFQCLPTTQNGALTPSSFRVEPIDPNGCARLPPIRVSPILIYVEAGQRQLRELSYNFSEDNFKSPQLFRFSEHLMDGFFIDEMFYSSAPDSIIYIVRNDGTLLGLAYEQVENVIAWFRIETDGDFKSGCRIPRPETGKDWIWTIVSRGTGIFIEYFEPDHPGTGREWNDLHTDSAIVATHDANFVVTGLDHLQGKTVKVIGDGMLFEDAVVGTQSRLKRSSLLRFDMPWEEPLPAPDSVIDAADRLQLLGAFSRDVTAYAGFGQIVLDPQFPVSKVEVGLSYDARVVPVEPMVPAEAGGPMIARGYSKIGVRLRQALGLTLRAYRVGMNEPGDDTIAGEQLTYRKPYHAMDNQVPLQRGKKCVLSLGYDPFARIEIRQALPFPAEILNVVGKLHVGDEWDCETYNDSEVFF